jgi:hypothetical protein
VAAQWQHIHLRAILEQANESQRVGTVGYRSEGYLGLDAKDETERGGGSGIAGGKARREGMCRV